MRHDAMVEHPDKRLRRAAQRQIGALEKEIGFDIKVIKGTIRSGLPAPGQDAETLHAQLLALRSLSERLVVIFDALQRLRHCTGDPLAIIRSALMSTGAGHVSLLFTGSIRNALRTMLEISEAAELQLPTISHADSLEYLDYQFTATGKPADETRSTTCCVRPTPTLVAHSSWPGSAGWLRWPAAALIWRR